MVSRGAGSGKHGATRGRARVGGGVCCGGRGVVVLQVVREQEAEEVDKETGC